MPTAPPQGRTNRRLWRFTCLAAILLSAAAFTPLVIPEGRFDPMLGGVPLTLWAGVALCIAQVVAAYLGTLVHPGYEAPADPDRPA
jgi:hypothetical protein